MVDVGEVGCSNSSIGTTGLTGCYGFLIDGLYNNDPFCFLDHHSYSVDQNTLTPVPKILLSLIKGLVKIFEKKGNAISRNIPIDFTKLSNMTLVVCGGIQQDPDYIRRAFGLLQEPFDLDLLNVFSPSSPEFILCQQLNRKTIIIDAVGYLLSDEIEDMAAEMGKYLGFAIAA